MSVSDICSSCNHYWQNCTCTEDKFEPSTKCSVCGEIMLQSEAKNHNCVEKKYQNLAAKVLQDLHGHSFSSRTPHQKMIAVQFREEGIVLFDNDTDADIITLTKTGIDLVFGE